MLFEIEYLKISTPYVTGKIYDKGRIYKGNAVIGINKPQRKTIGNLKKFEKVCASKTSFADTAIKIPSKVDTIDNIIIPLNNKSQFNTEALKYNTDIKIGIKLFKIPNKIAPDIFAKTSRLMHIGASNNLSNERALLSNVMVTESIEVVPNRIDIATIPGNTSLISKADFDFIKSINIHAKGKIMPQLIFGGFK